MADPVKMWLSTPFGYAIAQHIKNGFKVFPVHGIKEDMNCTCNDPQCGSRGKHPFKQTAPHGFLDATGDIETVADMFCYRSDLNVGVATGEVSGILVIDVDNKDHGKGSESLAKLQDSFGDIPETMTLKTGNGFHLVFDYPKGEKIKTSSKSFGDAYPAIDVRSNGGYIVIYPSRHWTGRYYEADETNSGLSDIPDIYLNYLKLDRVKKQAEKKIEQTYVSGKNPEWSEENVREMLTFIHPDNDGYMAWVEIGFALQDAGYTYHLFDEWSARGTKYVSGEPASKWGSFSSGGGVTMGTIVDRAMVRGWQPKHIERVASEIVDAYIAPLLAKIKERRKKEKAEPTKIELILQREAKGEKIEKPKIEFKTQFCFDPAKLFGPLGDTIRWIEKSAMFPQPELAMLNVLSYAGAVFGRRYASPRDTRTNMYTVAVARTGAGKGHSRKMIGKLAMETGLNKCLGGNSIRSDTGMLRGLFNNSSQLLMLDEFGMFMQALSDKNASPHIKSISRVLMSLYSDSNSVYHHGDYADEKSKAIVIAYPNLCIYGTTTESSYLPALKRSAIESGELNRFIAIPSRVVPNPNFDAPPAEHDEDLVGWWKQFSPKIGDSVGVICNSGSIAPKPITVEWGECDSVQQDLLRYQVSVSNSDHPLRDLWTRIYENTIKLAMIFAIARDPFAPEFIETDFEYGRSIVEASINYMVALAEYSIAETPQEQMHHEIYQAILNAGSSGMTRRDLLRKFRKMRKRELDDIVGTMVEEEIVFATRDDARKSGIPVIMYYAIKNKVAA